jgi:YggT family protein
MILDRFVGGVAYLLHLAIHFYTFIIIVRAVISWMGNIPYSQFIYLLRRLTDPAFRLVHRYVPFAVTGGIDISPIIIIIALQILDQILYSAFPGLVRPFGV